MRIFRAAAVTLAALALTLVSACKETSTGPGAVTCVASDPVCPSGTLALGFTGATGAPTIVPAGGAGTSIAVSTTSYVVAGTTSATTYGYWLLVTNDVLTSWGVLTVTGTVYGAEIPLFCGAQRIYFTFTGAGGRSYYVFDMNRTGCTGHAAFRVQLTWTNITSDLDLHLLRPTTGVIFSDTDCYFGSCKAANTSNLGLEWGATGAAGNPILDVDDTSYYGPENIYLTSGAEAGQYRIIIHNYSGEHYGDATGEVATVRIYLNDLEVRRYVSTPLNNTTALYWEVAKVNILTGAISDVGHYSSTPPTTLGAAPPARAPIAK
jgi:hypothetical protein